MQIEAKKPRPKHLNPEKNNPSHRVLVTSGGAAWPTPLLLSLASSNRAPLTQDPLPYLHPPRHGLMSLLSMDLGPHPQAGPHLAMGPHKSKHEPTVPTDLRSPLYQLGLRDLALPDSGPGFNDAGTPVPGLMAAISRSFSLQGLTPSSQPLCSLR